MRNDPRIGTIHKGLCNLCFRSLLPRARTDEKFERAQGFLTCAGYCGLGDAEVSLRAPRFLNPSTCTRHGLELRGVSRLSAN
jgi:hypothetical protein